uniref:DNA 5'-3' helicase n=1 Tax=Brassica campestris TaxID=3711 RepID=M4EP04_BRACM
MEMEEGEGSTEEKYDVDIATTASSLGGSGVFHIINDILGFVLYMHQQIPSVLQDMSLDFDGLQTEFTDLEANLTQPDVKPLVRRKLLSRKREVKHEIKKMQKLMSTISTLRSALQLLIREAPGVQRVVLILGGSPLRPQKAYELFFTHSVDVLRFEGDFSKNKATEALSKKTIRALISTGAGSTSCPGPMRLFILVQAPPSLNLPQHFLPKRDFRYNRKFVPLKLRFKCKTQDNETNSPFNYDTNDLIWFLSLSLVNNTQASILAGNRSTLLSAPTPISPVNFICHSTRGRRRKKMIFKIEDVTVYFPYDNIYPEQYEYMVELKRALDAKGHCLLEMPTGTGKTIALLSLITSYRLSRPDSPIKLVYCTRTVHEMEKTLGELKILHDYQVTHLGAQAKILALGLSSRKNLCVNPKVLAAENRDSVDAACRKRTASWVRALAAENPNVELCDYFESYEKAADNALLPPGVYTLEDLRAFGKNRGWCPYFLARHMVQFANVIVYSYQYLLDPKVAGIISKELQKESVIVFDEAHNIDNVCIEALSVSVRRVTLEGANRNLNKIRQEIDRFKATDAGRLRAEYNRLIEGLALRGDLSGTDQWLANPALPNDILKEAVPGNIRRAEHFVHVLRRLLQYLEGRLDTENVEKESPVSFVSSLNSQAGIEQKTLKFCYDRLHSLMMTLEITDTDEFLPIQTVCDFATLVGTYARGFSIIIEPYDERMPHIPDPILQLSCHDASLAIKPVFDRFQSVVITSGTLSPIDLYPRLLSFNPVVSRSFKMSMTRDCICPMVLTRGSDQLPVSTKFDMRSDPGVVRNYGKLLVEMVSVVPDGVVCFFVSYSYMDGIIATWNETGILKEITQQKLVFFETQDVVETTLALDNYRRACDCGRGAVFFSVARGKVAEGIDFDRHYGRLVVMFGVPFQYTLSKILLARLEYLRDTFQIKEGDFLTFDALRQAAQCVGRVIRSKADYGMMIFADKRYSRHDKRSKLPGWILSHLRDAHLNLSTDMAIHIAREENSVNTRGFGEDG